MVVFGCLTAVSVLGTITLFGIRTAPEDGTPPQLETENHQESKWARAKKSAKEAFFEAVELVQTRDILLQIPIWLWLQITKLLFFLLFYRLGKLNSSKICQNHRLSQIRLTMEWKLGCHIFGIYITEMTLDHLLYTLS